MKKTTILSALFLIFCTSNVLNAQVFQGQATYMSKRVLKDAPFNPGAKIGLDDAEQKQMREQMKKAFEKTYILDFNATESSYLKEVALSTPQPKQGDGMSFSVSFSGDSTPLYKNSKTKQYIQELEGHNGKPNLITDNLPIYDWKIEGETKKIGDYDCYKAVAIIKVTPKQLANYEEQKQKEAKRKKAPLFPAKVPEDQTITAWFTNAIPVSHGPAKYWGLPGLILEITEGKTTMLCSKIVLNPKNKKPITVPKKGKVISQDEFDKAQKLLYDKMANEDGIIMHETRN